MKMTKTLAIATFVAGSLFAGSLALQAQDTPQTPPSAGAGPGAHARPNAEQIAKDLGLTDDQKAKVKAALEEQQAAMKTLHENTTLSKEDKRTQMKALRESFLAKMKEILTPDQFEKWQKAMQHNRPSGGGQKPQAPPANQ